MVTAMDQNIAGVAILLLLSTSRAQRIRAARSQCGLATSSPENAIKGTKAPRKIDGGRCIRSHGSIVYTPTTLTGAGPPANGAYQQGLQPMTLTN